MPVKNKMDFKKIRTAFFLGIIITFGIAVLYIFLPFIYPIFWASVLAIMFYPVYQKLRQSLKLPGLSAVTTVGLVIIMVFLPLFIVSMLLINESLHIYNQVADSGVFGSIDEVTQKIQNIPYIGSYLGNVQTEWANYATSAAKAVSMFIINNLTAVTQSSIRFIFLFFIMLYTLYFFLKDGKRMLSRLMHLSPLGDEYEEMLYERFTSTARATLKGTLIIGFIQGTIGGILFWATGVQGALVWGVLMIVLSIIPAVGSTIIWFPTGLIMLATGQYTEGIIILACGVFVISLIDNVLRPPLVGKDTQMHPILVLFSTLGGISLFGISGFVIGPVITSLFLAIISMYDHYYKKELQNN